jgi:hypothetical protein
LGWGQALELEPGLALALEQALERVLVPGLEREQAPGLGHSPRGAPQSPLKREARRLIS